MQNQNHNFVFGFHFECSFGNKTMMAFDIFVNKIVERCVVSVSACVFVLQEVWALQSNILPIATILRVHIPEIQKLFRSRFFHSLFSTSSFILWVTCKYRLDDTHILHIFPSQYFYKFYSVCITFLDSNCVMMLISIFSSFARNANNWNFYSYCVFVNHEWINASQLSSVRVFSRSQRRRKKNN